MDLFYSDVCREKACGRSVPVKEKRNPLLFQKSRKRWECVMKAEDACAQLGERPRHRRTGSSAGMCWSWNFFWQCAAAMRGQIAIRKQRGQIRQCCWKKICRGASTRLKR